MAKYTFFKKINKVYDLRLKNVFSFFVFISKYVYNLLHLRVIERKKIKTSILRLSTCYM